MEETKNERNFPLVNELITKSVQFFSAKDDQRKFRVYPSKNTYLENENVILNATLYNETYQAVNSSDVKN